MKFADLHLHTNYSDGTYSPQDLVSKAQKAGLCAIAIVDHDTVSGVAPSIEAARGSDTEIIPGIELSAENNGQEVHILGYLVDYKNEGFLSELDSLKHRRIDRVYKMVDRLNSLGIKLKPESVFDIVGNGTVGRLHIARALVSEGLVSSVYEVFEKYLGDNCSAYVSGFRFNPQDAIEFIKDAGGIPVLAHPYSLNNDDLILEFIRFGLMGIEVYYPEHSQGMINLYLRMAQENSLLVTGGSDCHGAAKPHVRIGSIKIPYDLVAKIKEAKERLK